MEWTISTSLLYRFQGYEIAIFTVANIVAKNISIFKKIISNKKKLKQGCRMITNSTVVSNLTKKLPSVYDVWYILVSE